MGLKINDEIIPFLGLVDTGASITAFDKTFIETLNIDPIRTTQLLTANGVINVPIYKSNFQYENMSYELEYTISDIKGLQIQALIGKNFIDQFNLMFLDETKLFCFQTLK